MPDLSHIRLVVLDVDGVLTDNGLWVGSDGTEHKRFHIPDGAGLRWMIEAGIEVALISGHASGATRHRFEKLGVREIAVGVKDKARAFEELLQRLGVPAAETVAVGDDLQDLPMLHRAGLSVAPADAHPHVRREVMRVLETRGGHGAVRELAEILLGARGAWEAVIARYEA